MYTKYFIEIKNRFILIAIALFTFIVGGYYYKKILLFLLIEPNVNNPSYLIFTNVTEIFYSYLESIFFFSFQLFLFILLQQITSFILPSLFITEYIKLIFLSKLILTVFILSIFGFNYFFIPSVWFFFFSFHSNNGINLYFEAKLIDYLYFYISLYSMFVSLCQIFSVIFILFYYFNADIILIKKFRKLFYFILVLFSTLISPPDMLSQLIISLNAICFFELVAFITLIKKTL